MGLIPKERRFQLQELHWETFTEIMRAADPVVKAGGCRALELSKLCKYWRTEKVVEFMIRHGLSFIHDVSRCAYVDVSKHVTARHDYRMTRLWRTLQSIQKVLPSELFAISCVDGCSWKDGIETISAM